MGVADVPFGSIGGGAADPGDRRRSAQDFFTPPPGVDTAVELGVGDFGVAGVSAVVAGVGVSAKVDINGSTSSNVVVVVAGDEGVKTGELACDEDAIVAVVDTDDRSRAGVESEEPGEDNSEATERGCTGVASVDAETRSLAGGGGGRTDCAVGISSATESTAGRADAPSSGSIVAFLSSHREKPPIAAEGNRDLYSGGGRTFGPTEMGGASAEGGGRNLRDDRGCRGGCEDMLSKLGLPPVVRGIANPDGEVFEDDGYGPFAEGMGGGGGGGGGASCMYGFTADNGGEAGILLELMSDVSICRGVLGE